MKRITNITLSLTLSIIILLSIAACGNGGETLPAPSQIPGAIKPSENSRVTGDSSKIRETEQRDEGSLAGEFIIVENITNDSLYSTESVTLSAIDYETGEEHVFRQFVRPNKNIGLCAVGDRLQYSQDFKMLCADKVDNGRRDAGWLTEDGNFFNATEAIYGKPGEFSSVKTYFSVGFGVDGYFYFREMLDTHLVKQYYDAKYYRVPMNNLSKDAVEDIDRFNGMIQRLLMLFNDENHLRPLGGGYETTDWLNDTQCISHSAKTIIISDGFTDDEKGKYTGGFSTPKNVVDLLPKVDGRSSWDGFGSPDGSKVAFLSCVTSGNDTPALFWVDSGGGDPAKIATSVQFSRFSSASSSRSKTRVRLLSWEWISSGGEDETPEISAEGNENAVTKAADFMVGDVFYLDDYMESLGYKKIGETSGFVVFGFERNNRFYSMDLYDYSCGVNYPDPDSIDRFYCYGMNVTPGFAIEAGLTLKKIATGSKEWSVAPCIMETIIAGSQWLLGTEHYLTDPLEGLGNHLFVHAAAEYYPSGLMKFETIEIIEYKTIIE